MIQLWSSSLPSAANETPCAGCVVKVLGLFGGLSFFQWGSDNVGLEEEDIFFLFNIPNV